MNKPPTTYPEALAANSLFSRPPFPARTTMVFRTLHLRRVPLDVAQAAHACSQKLHVVAKRFGGDVDDLRPSWPPPGVIDLDLRLMDGATDVRITDVRTVAAFLDATSTAVLIEVALSEMVEA